MKEAFLKALQSCALALPQQRPLPYFVTQNILCMYEDKPFHETLNMLSERDGAKGYLSLERYREALKGGRIDRGICVSEIHKYVSEKNLCWELWGKSSDVFYTYLLEKHWVRCHPDALGFFLRHVKPQPEHTLWEACVRLAKGWNAPTLPRPVLPFDTVAQDRIHRFMIPWSSAYMDQGSAYWCMPYREEGFFKAVCKNMAMSVPEHTPWLGVMQRLCAQTVDQDPVLVCVRMLQELGVSEEGVEEYMLHLLKPLRGWAGMMHRLERFPFEWGEHPYPASLTEYVAVLLVARRAIHGFAYDDPHADDVWDNVGGVDGAYGVWQWVDGLGVSLETLQHTDVSKVHALLDETLRFLKHDVYVVFQEAYEKTYRETLFGALLENRNMQHKVPKQNPSLQAVFCIDDREECIRRYIEEQDSSFHTLGTAGFFGLPIAYAGIDHHVPVALCPVVQKPLHVVVEEPLSVSDTWAKIRQRQRAYWGRVLYAGYIGSRSLSRGFVWSVLGWLTLPSALLRVFNPFLWSLIRAYCVRTWLPKPATRLAALGDHQTVLKNRVGSFTHLPVGMRVQDAALRLKNVCEEMGLRAEDDFADWVVMVGHTSTSSNNPHAAAYACGACSGGQGGPNARLFATMANHPQVRKALSEQGIHIPERTWFVGAEHDTCTSEMHFFDLQAIPAARKQGWIRMHETLLAAAAFSAQERCRRFMSASLDISQQEALKHVRARAYSLAEPRPECGHATHACVVVGDRHATRGLFLDRRAFLVSYDFTFDSESTVLERILGAVVPVCTGINLGYYFSHVDPEWHGSGTKLPHNVAGLMGVMNGHQSDLRTGLSWQMVEIHEPMRLVLVIQSPLEHVQRVLDRKPAVLELARNGWFTLVVMEPGREDVWVYGENGFMLHRVEGFVLRKADSYQTCWKGERESVAPVRVEVAA